MSFLFFFGRVSSELLGRQCLGTPNLETIATVFELLICARQLGELTRGVITPNGVGTVIL